MNVLDILELLKKYNLNLDKKSHLNKTYKTHVEECVKITQELIKKYGFSEVLSDFAILFCCLHDIGKLLPAWDISKSIRPYHSIEGAEWLLENKLLDSYINDEFWYNMLIYAIITHHFPLIKKIDIINAIIEAEKIYNKSYKEYKYCKNFISTTNFKNLIKNVNTSLLHEIVDIFGILKTADILSASGVTFEKVLIQYEWLSGLENKIENGIKKRAEEKRGFFNENVFRKQLEIADSKNRNVLIAAPTGWGKTAVALCRMMLIKPTKVFYILPTITAIKDFYETFNKIISEEYIGEYFYFADVELAKRNIEEKSEYIIDLYKYFIPKVIITTIDQLLLTTLNVGKYHIRRYNLRNSLIVFDEFHLLTPGMIAALRFLLRNLSNSYSFQCLFMSATPSPMYIELIKEVVPNLNINILREEYKRLRRHKIKITGEKVEDFIIKNKELLYKKRTLIIVNTVAESQKIYKILKEEMGNSRKITLIHGDYSYRDRSEKENQISNTDILIATQVAEVSLDISFEVLITELAPLPSLIQRFGRVNRYGGTVDEINVYICEPLSEKPYGYTLINDARENLESFVEEIERKGEEAYLDEKFWEYETLYKKDIENCEDKIGKKIIEDNCNFFAVLADEKEILEYLGREKTYLAIPEIYLGICHELYDKLKSEGYDWKTYTRIKECFVPALKCDIKDWDDKLGIPVVKNYDKDLGIIRYRN